jgi:prepilin-type N-terminal cleavage/methylation domain-containing protein
MRQPRRPRRASGFSLLEVLVAMSILVGCLAVLSELAAIGRQHVQDARMLTAAQAICETRVNEILAGVKPPEPIEEQTVDGLPGWQCSVSTQPLPQPGLLELQVTVRETSAVRRARSFTLVQWIRVSESREDGAPPPSPSRALRGEGRP